MQPQLSIVIPAWNEAARLPPTLKQLSAFCAAQSFASEVVVVVEASRDDTLTLAHAHARRHAEFEVIENVIHRGKGSAVRTGMLHARGELLFYMDADLSVPLREVTAFLKFFNAHPDAQVLVGNRAHAQSRITRRQAFLRQRMGQAFNRMLQWLGLVSLHDTQCGFKAFRHDAARAIFERQTLDGFAFDVEVLLLAEGLGYRVADLPVEWINSPESKVRIVRDSLAMLRDTARVRRLVAKAVGGAGS